MRTKLLTMPTTALLAIIVSVPLIFGGPSARAATEGEIETAVVSGLAWLESEQQPAGDFGSDGDWRTAVACLAVLEFEGRALDMGLSPFDPAYPYQLNVKVALDYVFAMAVSDGDGVHFGGTLDVYTTAICMMAVAASGEQDRVVSLGASPVHGWTFEQVVQGMMDWMEFAQNDSGCEIGGWGYMANQAGYSDNSNTGYAALGIGFAARMGVYPQAATLTKLETFIDNVQRGDGGSDYSPCAPWNESNILRTGHLLYEMALVGRPLGDPTVQAAIGFIEAHWNDPYDVGWQSGPDQGDYHAMFTMMEGLEAYGIDTLGAGIGDWFDEASDYIVAEQEPAGYWSGVGSGAGVYVLETSWALLTLGEGVPLPPPSDCPYFPPGETHDVQLQVCFDDVRLDQDMNGTLDYYGGYVCFTGSAKIWRSDAYRSDGYCTIDKEMKSLYLTATVGPWSAWLAAGPEQGVGDPSTGTIVSLSQVPGEEFPAVNDWNVNFKIGGLPTGELQNCDLDLDGTPDPATLEAQISTIPPYYMAHHGSVLAACDQGGTKRAEGEGAEGELTPSVGGAMETLDGSAGPDSSVDSSSGSGFNYTALGGALAAVAVALAAGAWFARRRWAR